MDESVKITGEYKRFKGKDYLLWNKPFKSTINVQSNKKQFLVFKIQIFDLYKSLIVCEFNSGVEELSKRTDSNINFIGERNFIFLFPIVLLAEEYILCHLQFMINIQKYWQRQINY